MFLLSISIFPCILHVTCHSIFYCRTLRTLQNARIRVQEIACGHAHTVLLTEGGEVWSCGSNERGQCGQDTSSTRPGQFFLPLSPLSPSPFPFLSFLSTTLPSLPPSPSQTNALESVVLGEPKNPWVLF